MKRQKPNHSTQDVATPKHMYSPQSLPEGNDATFDENIRYIDGKESLEPSRQLRTGSSSQPDNHPKDPERIECE